MSLALGRISPTIRLRLALLSAAVTACCAAVLLATSPGLPMGWDEGSTILRAESQGWPYTTQHEGHPAFSGMLIAAGQWLSGRWLAPLEAARFGPIVLFSIAAGAMCYRLGREYSPAAGLAGAAALLVQPRLFAHAHFATLDGPLTAAWLLAWAAFAPARRDWRWSILWGFLLGMTMSTKATGWLAPLPFVLWALAVRDRASWRALAVGLPVAVATFFLFNPPLWSEPLSGTWTFFSLNLDRAAQPGLNISTQFFGRMYNLDHPLPWYNTIVWTAITVPVGILALAGLGLARVLRHWRSDQPGLLLVGNWAVLLVVRALPMAPPHDAERLILPSFAFLAALAGIGAVRALNSIDRARQDRSEVPSRKWMRTALVLSLYAGALSSVGWYAPQWLSYYNLAIGGLRGAAACGMEPTYYWDALDRHVLDWLEANTSSSEKVQFAAPSPENLTLMRRWDTLRCECRHAAPGEYRWYVVEHRPSAWQAADRWLVEREQPAFAKTIRQGGWGPWRLNVPLLTIYPHETYRAAPPSP